MADDKMYYAVMLKKGFAFLRIGSDRAALESFSRGAGENLVVIVDKEKQARMILKQQSSGHKLEVLPDVTLAPPF